MARLPYAVKSRIEAEKIHEYLLSSTHPAGRFKAAFFQDFGYSAGDWDEFKECLRQLILSQDVIRIEETPYGQKCVVEGALESPSGELLPVVTVWIIPRGQGIPRFITAYPGGLR